MDLILIRVGQSSLGTFGVLRYGQVPFALTLERPWMDNEQEISCIPTGRYICKRIDSPHFGDTFEVTGVPGRTHILFHKGNRITDTQGCILVGEEFGGTFYSPMILSSAKGFGEFMDLTSGESTFTLYIMNAPLAGTTEI